jgi:hypothetical protein
MCQFDDMGECQGEDDEYMMRNVKKPLKAKADNGFLIGACRTARQKCVIS